MILFARLFPVLLSLALAFGSVATIGVPGFGGPDRTLVICTDGAARTVTLDADGNPVSHAHDCLDCCLAIGPVPQMAAIAGPAAQIAPEARLVADTSAIRTAAQLRPHPRGPPRTV
ncbi:MAG: hypothetical protein K8F59_09050 [Rhodobacteraceae bacterium]|nr:hypothetical protein [Paracoccaceae bacterium]